MEPPAAECRRDMYSDCHNNLTSQSRQYTIATEGIRSGSEYVVPAKLCNHVGIILSDL